MTKVTLYYADWCGHCIAFKPTWSKLKEIMDDNQISYDEFESNKNADVIKRENIQGYPTIKITKNGKTYDYFGNRDLDSLKVELGISKTQQKGGSYKINVLNYKIDKYKRKYNKLKIQKGGGQNVKHLKRELAKSKDKYFNLKNSMENS